MLYFDYDELPVRKGEINFRKGKSHLDNHLQFFQRVVFYFVQHQAREGQPVCLDKLKVSFFLCYILFTLEPRSKLVISHFRVSFNLVTKERLSAKVLM